MKVLKSKVLHLLKKPLVFLPGLIIVIAAIILSVGLTATFVRASGRFNLPLSWILSPSGVSVDLDNNGIVDYVDAGIPSGLIVMWSGTLASIPSGWNLCDGTNGTPDLRDKFIYGWTDGVDPGGTGGATTHSHTYSDVPIHSHTTNVTWPEPAPRMPSQLFNESAGANTGCETRDGYVNNCDTASVSVSINDYGVSNPTTDESDHLPPYYKLAYIMKL